MGAERENAAYGSKCLCNTFLHSKDSLGGNFPLFGSPFVMPTGLL